MVRKIIDYLPHVLREYREVKGIADGQQWLFDNLWDEVDKAFNDQYLDTATANGISRWEKILKIIPKGSDTLEAQRFRIKTRLNEQLPFTIRVLNQQLSTLCGPDGYSVKLEKGTYILQVKVDLTVKSCFEDVNALLHRIVPAEIVIDLTLKYNTHEALSSFTYAGLSAHTHGELRSEVFSNVK